MLRTLVTFVFAVVILFSCSDAPEALPAPAPGRYRLAQDVEWATPDGHALTMDIYTPDRGQQSYPVLVIFHGGGWLINDKSPLTAMSEYVAGHAPYVVCNVNYRLLVDLGNTVTMDQIIEDAMGAVLWIKEHIAQYGGDPEKLVLTGDSAGGHLAAMVVLAGSKLDSQGFQAPEFNFTPSYLPQGALAEEIARDQGLKVSAAILSYAAFDIASTCRYGGYETAQNIFWTMAKTPPRGIFGDEVNIQDHPEFYEAVSPINLIPDTRQTSLPPILCTAGSKDFVVPPQAVKAFVKVSREKGHEVEYWEHEGRNHAYLDGGSNPFLGTEFNRDGIPAIQKIIEFMDGVFAAP